MSGAGLRTMLKSTVERVLCASGAPRVGRAFGRERAIVLAYHNIVPHGESAGGDRSLHLPQREFGRQLELLARTHDVVPLDELYRPARRARPRAVVTFDDAYVGALSAGLAELERVGVPATVFVAPAFVGGRSFWWDVLADPEIGLPERLRQHVLEELAGDDAAARNHAARHGLPLHPVPEHQTVAGEAQLRRAASGGCVALASHTLTHRNLARLDEADVRSELAGSLAWLRERFDGVLAWLSYPYGSYSAAVARLAGEVGYEGALRVDGGRLSGPVASGQQFVLPRLNVPAGLSLRGFDLRVSGVLSR